MKNKNRNIPVPARKGRRAIWAAASLALVATACGSPDALGSTQLALSDGESNFNPVMVTSGTCRSKGFRPIDDAEACSRAGDVLHQNSVVSSPIASAPNSSTPHGCSITTYTLDEERTQLGAVFHEGDAQQLDAQACSHDTPCICADGESGDEEGDASVLCRDGQFQPDPTKYYTIRSPNGRYLWTFADGVIVINDVEVGPVSTNLVLLTPIEGDAPNADLVNDPSDARLHWRFEAAGDEFSPINRSTGTRMISDTLQGPPVFLSSGENALRTSGSPNASPFHFTCRGSQVFFDQDGFSPVDADVPTDNGQFLTWHIVHTEPASPGFITSITRKSGCMKKSRSCSSVYGRGFEQTRRRLCGPFNTNHRLTCEKPLGVPVSMHVPQGWYIEEVESFSRAVAFDPAPVEVVPLVSASSVADSLASFGLSAFDKFGAASAVVATNSAFATGSGPLYGALFSVGVNAAFELGALFGVDVFEQPDPVAMLAAQIEQALVKLAADINAHTEVLISNNLAQESARALSAQLNERRRVFYTEFPVVRATRLGLGDPNEVLRLADDVFDAANELFVDINVAFPTLGGAPSENDLRRAHFALDIAKLATIEEMIMLSEGILLEAHSLPHVSCEQIVADRALQVRADLLAEKLEGAVDGLVAFGNVSSANRINHSSEEFEFDARNFSYPIAFQLEFLDGIVEATTNKCHRLRDPEDSFRDHFEANTPVLP